MTVELDPNRIAAEVFHKMMQETVGSLAGGVKEVVRRIMDVFRKDLTNYVSSTLKKCTYIKTPIINRDNRIRASSSVSFLARTMPPTAMN